MQCELTAYDLIDCVTFLRRLKHTRVSVLNRVKARAKSTGESTELARLITASVLKPELVLVRGLRQVINQFRVGAWLLRFGFAPYYAANYLRYLDVRRARNPSSFWAYCGLAPGISRRNGVLRHVTWWHFSCAVKGRTGPRWIRRAAVKLLTKGLTLDRKLAFRRKAERLKRVAQEVGAPYPGEWDCGRLGRSYIAHSVRKAVLRVLLARLFALFYQDFHGEFPSFVKPIRVWGETFHITPAKLDETLRPLQELYLILDEVRGFYGFRPRQTQPRVST